MIKQERDVAKMLINAWVATVLISRQFSQTSAGLWHRAQPQQRPEADEGGALASEAGEMYRNPCFLLPFSFCGPPTGEESAPDGAEQAAPPGVVHINAAAAWRGEEAEFRDLSCKTRISRSCWAILLSVASHSAIDLQSPFFVVQFHAFPSQFPVFLGGVFGDVSVLALLCLGALCWCESS